QERPNVSDQSEFLRAHCASRSNGATIAAPPGIGTRQESTSSCDSGFSITPIPISRHPSSCHLVTQLRGSGAAIRPAPHLVTLSPCHLVRSLNSWLSGPSHCNAPRRQAYASPRPNRATKISISATAYAPTCRNASAQG